MSFLALSAISALFFAVAPSLFLAGDARRRHAQLHGGVLIVAAIVSTIAVRIGVELSPALAAALVTVAGSLTLGIALFLAHDDEVRVAPWRVALFAAGFYLLAFPFMQQTPIDGDEPYYLLVTESLVHDHDLDLSNQYATLEKSATGRRDLRPQPGDPVGPRGEIYSRHEPFLPLLLIPGYLLAGKDGAILTMLLFGVLLAVSLSRLLEESGLSQRAAILSTLVVTCGPPIVFFALRLWPEALAALLFSETLRAVRRQSRVVLFLCAAALALLKLRFVAIALPLVLLRLRRQTMPGFRMSRLLVLLISLSVIALPLLILWWGSGHPSSVHTAAEFRPGAPTAYLTGAAGLLVDAQHGIVFVAPLLFLGLVALFVRDGSSTSCAVLRTGAIAAVPYLVLLLPRAEWHGGWSPPMRYIAVFVPLLAIGLGRAIERVFHPALLLLAAAVTGAVTVHGLAYPWRLFHIENGESVAGEYLSQRLQGDVSRMLPSLVRPNAAAVTAVLMLIVFVAYVLTTRRARTGALAGPLTALALVPFLALASAPGARVELEDAHVTHEGGELSPPMWTVARFAYTGGWRVTPGTRLSFRALPGAATLRYAADEVTDIVVDGRRFTLAPTKDFVRTRIRLGGVASRSEVRCIRGNAVLDRIDHD